MTEDDARKAIEIIRQFVNRQQILLQAIDFKLNEIATGKPQEIKETQDETVG